MNHPFGNPTINFAKPTLILGNKNYSSWSLRGWLILHAFGVDFDEMPIKLFHESNHEILQNYTPIGKVPVLLHGKNTVWDSLAIALYAEKYLITQNIWGTDPATAMSLISEMHSGFLGLRNEMPMNVRAKRSIMPSPACVADIARFEGIVAECETRFGNQDYLLGEFSVADVFFAPIIFRLTTYATGSGITLKPQTQSYMTKMLAHPSMQLWQQQAIAETDILVAGETGKDV